MERNIMRLVHLIVSAVLLTASAAHASAPPRVDGTVSLPDVVAPLLPAVVSISVLHEPVGNSPETGQSTKPSTDLGSGFIIGPDGMIVTNRHVVAGGSRVTVTLEDGTTYPAHLIGTNALPDLALLKINANRSLPTVSFGDSNALRIGDTVIVIGNPEGLSNSISVGVVSALNRNLDSTAIDDFIQSDAAINHGNSGGPMFNLKGEVVGVNWALISPGQRSGSIGIGLAIPSRDAAFVVEQLRRAGRWNAGFAGMRLQQLTPEVSAALGLRDTLGAIVPSVWPNGPAEAAKIMPGDALLEFNHRRYPDVRALRRAIGETPPNTTVPLLIWRNRKEQTVELKIAEWPASAASLNPAGVPVVMPGDEDRSDTNRPVGLTMTAIDDAQHVSEDPVTSPTGVKVNTVAPHSLAADAGIQADDIILRVGSDRVATPGQVTDGVEKARQQNVDVLLVLLLRNSRPRWVPMRMHPR
jgi:serine protease Do